LDEWLLGLDSTIDLRRRRKGYARIGGATEPDFKAFKRAIGRVIEYKAGDRRGAVGGFVGCCIARSVARDSSVTLPMGAGAKWRLLKARPDPDLRYFSKRRACSSVENVSATINVQGRW
jgi:hypothetical protein